MFDNVALGRKQKILASFHVLENENHLFGAAAMIMPEACILWCSMSNPQ